MADFEKAFEKMIKNEGGYRLHTVPGDTGGQTYAGIARKYHPEWPGWSLIDSKLIGNPQLIEYVCKFYQSSFWDKIRGAHISNQSVAESLFDFAVNTGTRVAIKLAQKIVGATPDGIIGTKTLQKLNAYDERLFIANYALAKVKRYADIVNRDRSQAKFLLGWINRTMKGVISEI